MERRIMVVTCFGHLMSHYNMLVFPALILPLAGLMKLPMTEVLALSFWMYLLFGVMALPWGMAGDKWGGRTLILIMFVGSGLSGLAAALYMDSPKLLQLALAAIGLFSAIYHPIGFGLISKGVTRMTVALGYNAAFGGLGLVTAPVVTGLAAWISGPKAAFFVLVVLNAFGILLMMLLPLQEPSRVETKNDLGNNGMLGAFLILLAAMMLGGIAERGVTVILPTYLELHGQGIFQSLSGIIGVHVSGNLVATSVASLVYAVGMAGQYVGGHIGQKFECRYSYLVFHAICIPAGFLMSCTQDFPLVCMNFVYLFFLLGMQPIENTLVAVYSPKRLLHSAYGLKFVLVFGVGSVAIKMIERIDSVWGIQITFVALGLVSVLLVSTILLLIAWTNRTAEESAGRPEEAYTGK
jgi:MFS family permease